MTNKIWVACDARSGSTWLANLINYEARLRFLFEPFHPFNEPRMAPFGPFPYVRPGGSAPRLEAFVRSVFSEGFESEWSGRFAAPASFDGVLIKCIFSNLFLGWADQVLPEARKILLLRHPCAVAASKLFLAGEGWGWDTYAAQFWERPGLREDYLLPCQSVIRHARDDPFQHYVLCWATLNKVPLQQMREGRLHLVFYERLCLDPAGELSRIFRYLGHAAPGSVWEDQRVQSLYDAPSVTSHPGSLNLSVEERVAGWTRHVGRDATARSMEILDAFGIGHIYAADPVPIYDAESAHAFGLR
jgi:hypothetical protein